jgi:PAS domain S-box-containing protein
MATQAGIAPLRIEMPSIIGFLATVAIYLAAVRVGVLFMLPQTSVSLIWPASGAALASVWLFGRPAVVGVALAATAGHLFLGYDSDVALAVGVSIAVAAQAGALMLSYCGFATALTRLRDVITLLGAGVLTTATLSSLAVAAAGYATGMGKADAFSELWWLCWVAELVGGLVLVPVLFGWSGAREDVHASRQRLEAVGVLAAAAATTWLVYGDVLPAGIAMARPLSYLIFPVMIWAAVRTSVRDTALILLVHATLAAALTVNGNGPFATGELRESLLALHAHIGMLSMSSLILAAMMTERQAVTAALADSEAKYRLLVENQTDLVVKTDAQGRIVFASPTVAELFGGSVDDLLGRPFRDIVSDADGRDPRSPWRELQGPAGACYLERPANTREGQRWLGWAAKAVRDADGTVTGAVAVGRDVTARRDAEAQSREYFQELAHVGRLSAMGEMAAGLAHELNQPLCAMTTYAQACRRMLDSGAQPELAQAIDRVVANGERAGGIIQQMRAYVRNDTPESTQLDVNATVRDVLSLTDPELRQAGVTVDSDLASDLPTVEAVEIQIHQVLVNLVRNALEAMRAVPAERRSLLLTTARTASSVAVTVEDTGPGLDSEVLDTAFDPFVSAKSNGLGLGLSISRSIIDNHGGALSGENRTGFGARFRFTLPASDAVERSA